MQMQDMVKDINSGWPDMRKNCPKSVIRCRNQRAKLSCTKDIVFYGQKLIIPASMREERIKAMHIGHLGVQTCVCHARDVMFWLNTYVQADKRLHAWLHNLLMYTAGISRWISYQTQKVLHSFESLRYMFAGSGYLKNYRQMEPHITVQFWASPTISQGAEHNLRSLFTHSHKT